MSVPLTDDEETRYTHIIDAILNTADLKTISRKKIRMGLEAALGGKDLSENKDAIKTLIEARFDIFTSANESDSPPEMPPSSMPAKPDSSPKRPLNGHGHSHGTHRGRGSDDEGDANRQPKKKVKREASSEDADAKLAARLQAQEDMMSAGRTTRGGSGGSTSKPAKKKKAPRKKSDKKVGPDDDSEVDGSEGSAAPKKRGGGFQKPFNLSYALAEVCGETQLARTTVVKKLWEYIKANDLQDPKDKRQIRCDDKMHAIFKQARIDMFQMNKAIGHHLYPVEEE